MVSEQKVKKERVSTHQQTLTEMRALEESVQTAAQTNQLLRVAFLISLPLATDSNKLR
jgi:hypothetical protein